MVSMLTEWLEMACTDSLMEVVVSNVTLRPFEARRFENWSIGFM